MLGGHFEHLLKGSHRLARIRQMFAAQPTDLQATRHPFLGFRRERELSFGDRHHAWPVLHGLGHAPQGRVGIAVCGIHLVDNPFQRMHGGRRILEILLEDARPLQGQGRGVRRGLRNRHATFEQIRQGDEVAHGGGNRRQRLQGLAIGGLNLEQRLPGGFGSAGLLELAIGQSSQPSERFDLARGIALAGRDLEVEDTCEILVAVDVFVGHQQSINGLLVARHVLDDLLPVWNRLGEVAQLILQQAGDALDDV